ncbi:MAG: hypothetical protein MJ244_06210 [Clostridia bacterium]|nr:hypothetical protein [Clostridia bacterium]
MEKEIVSLRMGHREIEINTNEFEINGSLSGEVKGYDLDHVHVYIYKNGEKISTNSFCKEGSEACVIVQNYADFEEDGSFTFDMQGFAPGRYDIYIDAYTKGYDYFKTDNFVLKLILRDVKSGRF